MITIDLGYHRTARLWSVELPVLTCSSARVLQGRQPASGTSSTARRIALELYVPMGARVLYGLLGAEFLPQATEELILSVPVCAGIGDTVSWSLASRADVVRAGLPEEYAHMVLACVEHAATTLGAGALCFAPAAHADAGSAPVVFRSLALALIDLLGTEKTAFTSDAARDLIARDLVESQLMSA